MSKPPPAPVHRPARSKAGMPHELRKFDGMIYSTDQGPMMISRQQPHPRPVTDPALLAVFLGEGDR